MSCCKYSVQVFTLVHAVTTIACLHGFAYGQTPRNDLWRAPKNYSYRSPASHSLQEGILGNRTLVPLTAPRAGEDRSAGERWNRERKGPDAAPVSSFVDSYKGNDAVIRVILGQGRLR